jgi:hypothetical protein
VEVGQYHQPDGPLTLVDERVRAEALDALRAHGVDVDTPEDLTLGGFPDAVVVVGGGRWSIRLSKPGVSRGGLPEAGWFDPDSGTLTVYAAPLAEPLAVLRISKEPPGASAVVRKRVRAPEAHREAILEAARAAFAERATPVPPSGRPPGGPVSLTVWSCGTSARRSSCSSRPCPDPETCPNCCPARPRPCRSGSWRT